MDTKDKTVTLDSDKLSQLTLSNTFGNVRYINQENICKITYLNQAEDNQEESVYNDLPDDNLEDSS